MPWPWQLFRSTGTVVPFSTVNEPTQTPKYRQYAWQTCGCRMRAPSQQGLEGKHFYTKRFYCSTPAGRSFNRSNNGIIGQFLAMVQSHGLQEKYSWRRVLFVD